MTISEPSVAYIGSLRILYVMAAAVEYGAQLQARIDPLFCGVGPVEAAISTTATLASLARANSLPDLVFSLGSAGSRTLEHAGIFQVSSVRYRDMDASPLGFERGLTPFADHCAVIEIPQRIQGIASASLSTGASIISGAGYDQVETDMVDMECFAVLRAAQRYGIPTIGLRGISDGHAELSRIEDWSHSLAIIDERLATSIELFESQVRDGRFTL